MKVKTLSALAGLGGALIMSSSASAAPQLTVVSQNTTAPFLVANGLQSAVIGINNFVGENLQGFIGTAGTPFVISTSGGTFWNQGTTTYFNGEAQIAANNANAPPNGGFDTGALPTASGLGDITAGDGSNPISWAQASSGASYSGNQVFWLSLNPDGIAVPGTLSLLRLTWSALESATFSALLVTNTGGGQGNEYAVSITIPAVPAPGALALLGLAGVVGSRRRRA